MRRPSLERGWTRRAWLVARRVRRSIANPVGAARSAAVFLNVPPFTSLFRALYGLGRLLVRTDNPGRSYPRALLYFDRLLREHPDGPHAADAQAWRGLLAAYLARSQELERLKQADLELERRRSPVSGSSSSSPRR